MIKFVEKVNKLVDIPLTEEILNKKYTIKVEFDTSEKTRWKIKDRNKIEADITLYKTNKSDGQVLLGMGVTGRYFDTFDQAIKYFSQMKSNTFNAFNKYSDVKIDFIYK